MRRFLVVEAVRKKPSLTSRSNAGQHYEKKLSDSVHDEVVGAQHSGGVDAQNIETASQGRGPNQLQMAALKLAEDNFVSLFGQEKLNSLKSKLDNISSVRDRIVFLNQLTDWVKRAVADDEDNVANQKNRSR